MQLLKEDGEVLQSVGLRSPGGPSCLWRSVLQVRHEVQRSNPSTHIPRVLSVLERRPSVDRCASNGPSYLPSRVMKRDAEEIAQVWDDAVHDDPS